MAEQTGRKGSVTQTGAEATGLSSPDLRAASFSKQGVVDQSGLFRGEATARGIEGIAGGIRDFGQIALDIDEGLAKASLEKDVLNEIDALKESRDPDFASLQQGRFDEAAIELSAKEETRSLLKEDEGEGAAIQRTAPDFAEVTRRLKNAKRQGAISLDEFELRVLAATREAVAKRPGLINELRNHAQNVLDLSGIRQQVRFEDKLAELEGQADAKRRDRVIKQLDKANAVFDVDTPTEELETELNRLRRQDEVYEQGKRLREINQAVTQEEGTAALQQMGSQWSAGAFNEASRNMLQLFNEGMSSQELTSAKLQANRVVTQFRDEFGRLGRNLSVTNHPDFKDLRDNWMGAIENLSEVLQNAGSGAQAAEIAKNYMAVIQAQDKRAVYDLGFNQEALKAANLASTFIPFPDLFKRQPKFVDQLTESYSALLTESSRSPVLNKMLGTNIDGRRSDMALAVRDLMQKTLPSDRDTPEQRAKKSPDDFETVVNTALEVINNNIGTNTDLAFKTQTDLIRELSNPDVRSFLNNANDMTKATLVDLAVKQASSLEPDRNRFLQAARSQGVNIKPRVLPNGTLSFVTDNDTPEARRLLQQFNNKFTSKYNDLIKYHATLFNMSVPQASDLLSDIYSGGSREDIELAIQRRREGFVNSPANNGVKEKIKQEEGFREDAYLDQAGVPTIGYGFTTINGRPVQIGDTISLEQAERELDKQVKAHSTFKKKLNVPLTPAQEEALSSFEFNLGPNIWNTSGKSIISAINNGDLEAAAESMKRHNKVRDPNTGELKENRGLANRRNREASLLLGEG